MSISSELLAVKKIDHTSWQDADITVVTNIFTFFEQMGNAGIGDVVNNLFRNEEVLQNASLQHFNFVTSSCLDLLESIIDNYIESGLMLHDPQSLRETSNTFIVDRYVQAHQTLIYLMSFCAIRLHHDLQNNNQYNSYVNILMKPEMIATTVARKQRDYGPSNVSKFGIYGLIVRTHDKIGRLKNLLNSNRKNLVQDETVFDSLVDLVGYCVISMMWINNWFTLPMAEEYVWPSFETNKFTYI